MSHQFYNPHEIKDEEIGYAVIISFSKGRYVFVKHRDRETLEYPGGHREARESLFECAERELREETGAILFSLKQIGVYSMAESGVYSMAESKEYVGLFVAEITSFSKTLQFEIESVVLKERLEASLEWTYPSIQPTLIEMGQSFLLG